jgi:hypothetical protein
MTSENYASVLILCSVIVGFGGFLAGWAAKAFCDLAAATARALIVYVKTKGNASPSRKGGVRGTL